MRPTQPRLSSEVCFSILRELLGLINLTHWHTHTLSPHTLSLSLSRKPYCYAAQCASDPTCRWVLVSGAFMSIPGTRCLMSTSSCYPTASCIAALSFGECIRSPLEALEDSRQPLSWLVTKEIPSWFVHYDCLWQPLTFSAFAVVFHWTWRHEDATIDDFIDVLEEAWCNA